MPILPSNTAFVPFLSKPMTFIKGLDPLGLQNTSEATFALLLPGLNNVTGRVRFYSFYCWLLNEYSVRHGNTNPAEQRKFIRKAELIIALVNRSTENEIGGVPGSFYANRELKLGLKEHDLDTGTYNADGTTEGTYWKFPGGAFGQYYLGSLHDIGIALERSPGANVYVRTQICPELNVSGEALATAFDENIAAENKKLFFSCLDSGIIKASHLEKLIEDFNISIIPKPSRERSLLIKLLIQGDFPLQSNELPSSYRRKTILHLLKYSSKHDDLYDRMFTQYAYQIKGDNDKDDTLLGWYYYQLNEYWQYANLGVLNGLITFLEECAGPSWKNLYELVEDATGEIVKYLLENNITESSSDKVRSLVVSSDDWASEPELFELINESTGIKRIANSLMLIIFLYKSNLPHLDKLKEFGVNKRVEKDGDSVTYFLRFDRNLSLDITDLIPGFLLKNIIYRHQFVAFRKMGNGSQSTQLFVIEDGLIRKLKNNFEPTLTGPRIARLIRFLMDLNILNSHAKPTNEGLTLLNSIALENT